MDLISKLKSDRADKVYAMEVLAKKLDEKELPSDLVLHGQLKEDIAGIDAQLRKLQVAAKRAERSVPVYDPTAPATRSRPHRNVNLRAFKDRVERGVTVRAEEQAYFTAKFLVASVFGHPASVEWCRQRGITIKAQSEGVSAAGGVLVPDEMQAAIINLKEQFGVAAKYCQRVPMNRDSITFMRRTGGVSAFFVGEGTAPNESTANFDEVKLVAKKMAALVRMSTELSEDALINVADYLVSEIAYAFASKEDDCLFVADGTQTYGGMNGLKTLFATTATAGVFTATGHATYDTITTTDIAMWRGLLPQYALPGARFYCSQSFFSTVFRRLAATAGGNTISTLSNDLAYSWAGTPIVISQKLPAQGTVTGTIVAYYGDMAKAVAFGDRRQVTIKKSEERYFELDQVGLMGTERFDIVAHDVGTTSAAGALVALKMG